MAMVARAQCDICRTEDDVQTVTVVYGRRTPWEADACVPSTSRNCSVCWSGRVAVRPARTFDRRFGWRNCPRTPSPCKPRRRHRNNPPTGSTSRGVSVAQGALKARIVASQGVVINA